LPEAVAYSGIAGLPPQAGVIALFAGLVCYGVIGRSRYAIVSATSSSAAVLAAGERGGQRRRSVVARSVCRALVLLTGACFLLAGAARLGGMSNLIAKPVLRGYAFGLALVIAVKQCPTWSVWRQSRRVSCRWSVSCFSACTNGMVPGHDGCGIAALLLLFLLERLRRLPGSLAGDRRWAWPPPAGWPQHGVVLTGVIHLTPSWAAPALARSRTVATGIGAGCGAAAGSVCGVLQFDPQLRAEARRSGGCQSRPAAWAWPMSCPGCCTACRSVPAIPAPRPTKQPVRVAAGRFDRGGYGAGDGVDCLRGSSAFPTGAGGDRDPRGEQVAAPGVFAPYLKWRRDRLVALAAVLAVIALGMCSMACW
jgi:SulP family sulfate permease